MAMHIFTNQVPAKLDANVVEGEPGVTLGMVWTSEQQGVVRAVRFYLGNRNYDGATLIAGIYDWEARDNLPTPPLVQQNYVVTAANAVGWVEIALDTPLVIKRQHRYIVCIYYPCDTAPDGKAHYVSTTPFFDAGGIDNPPLHALRDEPILNRRNGVYNYGPAMDFPISQFNSGCYFVDVSFDYVATMPIRDQATGEYEHKVVKYRQGGQWHY